MDKNADITDTPAPDRHDVRAALEKICDSNEFSGSQRLQDFLRYVVDETLAGRGDQILGKTIAADVYKRSPSQDGDPSNLVRVDAGRLRRALEAYYNGAGEEDLIRIYIDPGQYAARFEVRSDHVDKTAETGLFTKKRIRLGAGIALVCLIAGAIVAFRILSPAPQTERLRSARPTAEQVDAEREALMLKSPAALQAGNLARQARDLIFPAIDPIRLQATRDMFEHAVRLDPLQFGGHAGLAQVIGLQAFRFPPGEEKTSLLELGMKHANEALQINPASAWTQSALGWMAFARGDIEGARSYSRRALTIAPSDLSVVDFDSLIAVFSGNFERALEVSNPAKYPFGDHSRHVFRVSYAVAKYHLGDYEGCIEALTQAAAVGSPIGPISHAYLIAAHQRAGHQSDARRLLAEFEKSWPNSNFHLALKLLFTHDEDLAFLLAPMRELGWEAPAR
ncbi:hypothetical protein [Roseibium sp.]|uniref:tetratricopeptide repeat protein n=1 Tax=Roseibium sp. TaxID=1936156 RepID=UPI003A9816F2